MDIVQFRTDLIEVLADKLGDDYKVMPCEALKNNSLKLYGVILKKHDRKIAPTIYIEQIFSDFKKHGDINASADTVIKLNSEYEIEEFDTGFYERYDNVKDKLFVKLISRADNEELLKNTPHRDFMDLSLIVYCDVSEICRFDASIIVKDEHIKLWGISADDLIDHAIDNTKRLGCSINDVKDFLKKGDEAFALGFARKMFVMTNKNLFYGAICMTYNDRLDEFCNKNKCNTYIIPSSIHEVILVPDTGEYNESDINSMIRDVNRYELKQDEVLSDHAYYYSVKDGYTCV